MPAPGVIDNARWTQVKDGLQAVAALLVCFGCVAGFLIWVTGGFRPQTQVAVDELTRKVTEISAQVEVVKNKIDQMPRVADYALHDAHLSAIDGQIRTIEGRLTRDEINAKETDTLVQQLRGGTAAPIRVPR